MPKEAGSFAAALEGRGEITITVQGRRTGKAISLPVWFVHDAEALHLLPVKGSRSQWFRNIQANPLVGVRAGRRRLSAGATAVVARAQARALKARFEAKYGADEVARYYTGFDALVRVPLTG